MCILRYVGRHLVHALVACYLAMAPAYAAAPDRGTTQLFGGFSYARSNRLPEHTFRGYLGGFSWAQNRRVRWTFENGGQWGPSNFRWVQPVAGTNREIAFDLEQSLFQVEGGPEFTLRRGRAILFAHALPGYGV